jgi:hypothetical protein
MTTNASRSMRLNTDQQAAPRQGREWWPWVVVSVLFVINLLWTGGLALSHDKALNDRLNYHLTARTLASGGGLAVPAKSDLRVPDLTPPYAVGERPLYPFLASLAIRLTGPSVQATNFVSALIRSLALLPIFALALRLFGRWPAIGTALLYTLSPPWTGLGATTMTGTTFALFYYLTLLLAVAYCQRPSRLLALLTGVSFTLVVMAREEGLILGLALVVIFVGREKLGLSPATVAGGKRRWLPDLLVFFAAPLLGYIGQKLYLWQTFGSLSSAAHPLFFNSEYEFLYALRLQTRAEYLASIGGVGGAIAVRLFTHLSQLQAYFADGLLIDTGQAGLFPLTFLLPFGIGVWGLVREAWAGKSQARLAALLGLVIVLHGLAWPSFLGRWRLGEIRHVQVITPFLMMLAADGLVRLWDSSLLRRALVILLVAHFLLFVFLYQILLVDVLAVAPSYDTAEIQALRQIEPGLDPGAILMSRKPNRAAYYTNRPAVMMPLAGFKDLMIYAQDHGVTHLVVAPRELRTRPGLSEGLATMGESIELLTQVGRIQIYQVHDYNFLTTIADGGPLDQEIDLAAPAPPPDWRALIRRADPSTIDQVWRTWRKWLGETP